MVSQSKGIEVESQGSSITITTTIAIEETSGRGETGIRIPTLKMEMHNFQISTGEEMEITIGISGEEAVLTKSETTEESTVH